MCPGEARLERALDSRLLSTFGYKPDRSARLRIAVSSRNARKGSRVYVPP